MDTEEEGAAAGRDFSPSVLSRATKSTRRAASFYSFFFSSTHPPLPRGRALRLRPSSQTPKRRDGFPTLT